MYCPNCGKLFSERDENCQRCGLPLELAKELDSLSKPETLDEETEERFHEIWERGRARYVGIWPFQESPGFFGAIKNCFVKFWSVDTRASRSEAWYWTLFLILLSALYTIPATYMISAPPMKIIDGEPMENGKAAMCVIYSGDAFCSIDACENLAYAVPDEGSNVWFDNVIIPKTAKNLEAAHAFINFLNDGNIAARNTEYIFYSTPNKAAMDRLDEYFTENETYNPPQEVLDRCEVFHDLGDFTEVFSKAWSAIKSAN